LAVEGGTVLASGHPILTNLNLRVEPGEHIAIVGPSGAGKSGLVGLFLGWHRLVEGRAWVNGVELDEGQIDALRSVTAWVDPAVHLFNRSLLRNVEFGSAGRRHPLMSTIAHADLLPVLERLDSGLQTQVGMGGTLLSGGEGQRVRIARAMHRSDVGLT